MSELKQQIVQQLPYLRRYARALTGSQKTGDGLIRDSLEHLLQNPQRFEAGGSLPLRLFKLFHGTIGHPVAAMAELGGVSDPMQRRVGERLAELSPADRQALLLVHQEGFSPAEASEILGLEMEEVERRIDHAWADLKRQPPTDVLIIEDEPVDIAARGVLLYCAPSFGKLGGIPQRAVGLRVRHDARAEDGCSRERSKQRTMYSSLHVLSPREGILDA